MPGGGGLVFSAAADRWTVMSGRAPIPWLCLTVSLSLPLSLCTCVSRAHTLDLIWYDGNDDDVIAQHSTASRYIVDGHTPKILNRLSSSSSSTHSFNSLTVVSCKVLRSCCCCCCSTHTRARRSSGLTRGTRNDCYFIRPPSTPFIIILPTIIITTFSTHNSSSRLWWLAVLFGDSLVWCFEALLPGWMDGSAANFLFPPTTREMYFYKINVLRVYVSASYTESTMINQSAAAAAPPRVDWTLAVVSLTICTQRHTCTMVGDNRNRAMSHHGDKVYVSVAPFIHKNVPGSKNSRVWKPEKSPAELPSW